MSNFYILFFILMIIFINYFIKKKNILSNYSGEIHQKFVGQKHIPLSGGVFFLFASVFILYSEYNLFCFFLFSIFLIGFFSDTKLLSSPKLRFLLQFIFIIIFIYFTKLNIEETRIYLLDILLNNFLFNCLFVSFCLMIVINGTNFMDGLNGLVIGYYLSIFLILINLKLFNSIPIGSEQMIYFALILFFLLILNISNQLYLGDSGAYSLGFLAGFFLISIYQNQEFISPFFIILLLWYPSFETLFSMIRKFYLKKEAMKPDNNHLHQLLFSFIKKKLKIKQNFSNNFASLIIILYNLITFIVASINIAHTYYQVIIIIFNISIYMFVYQKLFNYKNKTS